MKILLKEDNKIHAQHIKNILIKLEIKLNLHFDITITNDLNEIINYNRQIFEIINILDIMDENNKETGLNFAKQIRAINQNAHIIFLTAFDNFIKDAVNNDIEPLAFITKTDKNIEEQLQLAIMKTTHKTTNQSSTEMIQFKSEQSDILFLNINDIYMIQTVPLRQKYIQVETGYNSYICRGNLSDYEHISKNIVKCHKSILVNKSKILKIKKGSTSKYKIIEFDNKLSKDFPRCTLSDKYKANLI